MIKNPDESYNILVLACLRQCKLLPNIWWCNTSKIWVITIKYLYIELYIGNLLQIEAELWAFRILACLHFSRSTFSKWLCERCLIHPDTDKNLFEFDHWTTPEIKIHPSVYWMTFYFFSFFLEFLFINELWYIENLVGRNQTQITCYMDHRLEPYHIFYCVLLQLHVV